MMKSVPSRNLSAWQRSDKHVQTVFLGTITPNISRQHISLVGLNVDVSPKVYPQPAFLSFKTTFSLCYSTRDAATGHLSSSLSVF